ncbi:MAG: tetratricopeptide repeat protein, partial [Alphaproteobacteria bacterium]|nr:tetratricopeptide repeat protein [Alphaproteobacteria bacterium]
MFRRAISLKAVHRDLMFEAGWAALDTGHHDAAVGFLAKYLKRNPDNAKGHEFLSRAFLGLGRPDEAAAALERALARDPALEPSVRYFLGQAAFQRGERSAAAQALNRIQREDA